LGYNAEKSGISVGLMFALMWHLKGGTRMWGPGPWMAPMFGLWWIFPVVGLFVCLFFVILVVRALAGGGRFMCMGPHRDESEEIGRLRREIEDLREQMKKQQGS
jgi:hypothetical protein